MAVNILQLTNGVVADCQSLLDESADTKQTREYLDRLLQAALFIQNELTLYILPDGTVGEILVPAESYTQAPFAIFKTSIYLVNKLNASGTITLSNRQLNQLQSMDATVKSVRKRLDEIWGLENKHD